MELWQIILGCLVILGVVVGGYIFFTLQIMRSDPREVRFREDKNQDNGLIPKENSKK